MFFRDISNIQLKNVSTENGDKVYRWALIVVDIQNDFISGSLAIKNANEIIPTINHLIEYVKFDLIVFSKDWHPDNHCSFEDETVIFSVNKWPKHCVQDTWGADHPNELLINPPNTKVLHVQKGLNKDKECYSAFGGTINGSKSTLKDIIHRESIDQIFVCGLATDFCVFETAKDAAQICQTFILVDACRSMNKFDEKMAKKILSANIKLTLTNCLIDKMTN